VMPSTAISGLADRLRDLQASLREMFGSYDAS